MSAPPVAVHRVSAALDLELVRRAVAEDGSVAGVAGAARMVAIRAAVARAVRAQGILLRPDELAAVVRDATDAVAGLGPLERVLREPGVTDVLVNGPGEVWVERNGALERTALRFDDADALLATVLRVLGPLGHRLDRAQPFADARLPDGSRLHAVLPPVAPDGPVVTLRRFAPVQPSWDELAASGSVPPDAAALLRAAVADRRAVVVCGRTGTGKTTLLDLLLADVGADQRVLVLEDAPELRPRCPHVVRLEVRTANSEGAGEVGLRDLVRQALRMRPDRIVVGEVRGPELADVLQAMATGHEGCMTTVHARSAAEALVRMEAMALQAGLPLDAARAQLRTAFDVVAVLARGPGGRRGLVEIADVERSGTGPVGAAARWTRGVWS